MIKSVEYSYNGLNKDISKEKFGKGYYYDAQHIRLTSTDSSSTFSVINEKGNSKVLELPSPIINKTETRIEYNDKYLYYSDDGNSEINTNLPLTSSIQIIIGHTITRDSLILFSTDNNGFDCIWEVKEILKDSYDLELLYARNLNFSTSHPIQAVFNYENTKIQKIYWVDANNQLRFLNIKHSKANGDLEDLIDVNSNTINIVSEFDISQVKITGTTGGGLHTSGMIQYAYNLYRLNGAQTIISPLSQLFSLGKGTNLGGGEVNEVVGTIPILNIPTLDNEYTHIKLYAIKYTSYNQTPSISLIVDSEIDSYTNFSYNDDGSIISSISLDEFLFLGSNPIIPKHIEFKDNTLFAANIKELNFDIDFDARAYSFNSSGICNIKISNESQPIPLPSSYLDKNLPDSNLTTDMVNPDYDVYKYQNNGSVLGGTGKFISYNLTPKISSSTKSYKRLFKSYEKYRFAIEFYNNLGQSSLPKWIADFKAPFSNLNDTESNFTITINSAGISYLKSKGIVGYRVLRVERTDSNKTILCQGILNGMMFFDTDDPHNFERFNQISARKESADKNTKLPNHLVRHFDNNLQPLKSNSHLDQLNYGGRTWLTEVARDADADFKRSNSFQYNRMFNLYSPDILFGNISMSSGLKFKILGMHKSSYQSFWGQERNTNTKKTEVEGKCLNKIAVNASGGTNQPILNNISYLQDMGLIAPSGGGDNGMDFSQYYREYLGGFIKSTTNSTYEIYGTPEIAERGAGRTLYNNNGKLAYSNSMQSIITDDMKDDPDGSPGISHSNSYGEKCLVLVEGVDDINTSIDIRKSLEDIKSLTGISTTDGLLTADIVRTLENQYGGNSHEAKTRNLYIKVGNYVNITNLTDSTSYIENHGDIYINNFKFLRVNKTDTEEYSPDSFQWTEIVNFPVESSIDLNNRNDVSFGAWDNTFQPQSIDYHSYNRVYSQEPTLVQAQDVSYKFKKVDEFDTRILASKTKVPGEFIDSWTDFLDNEVKDLDGKYGPINALVNFQDELFSLQDKGVAQIIVNPRVQTQSVDNLSIELGRGSVLYDYKYLTTNSGTINKWSTVVTPNGFYYFDALNKSINKFPDAMKEGLSDLKMLHSEFNNKFNYNLISIDNPILKNGVNAGFDLLNNDVYFTLHQGDDSLTVVFNEKKKEFIDFKTYHPSIYINNGFKFFSTNTTNNKLYQHHIGEYNKFFDEYQQSYITLLLNPKQLEVIFNNIIFRSEAYLEDIDKSDITYNIIRAWNEYQDSGEVALNVSRMGNIRRKFRVWKAQIPRNNNSRDRIRNPWIFLQLKLDNTNNYKVILHDIILNYSI